MYNITITIPLENDRVPVAIKRVAWLTDQVEEIQKAALFLGATSVLIEKEEKKS